ncbi:MAG: FtsW/RodA/SpoVE family cell cycle protein [Bacteroidaceae bacterium]|nr:FtsW/RodA/SpoVE family cell cycle protein [Bacteroidaceae bacterium]MBR5158021.1 FtsW/RodA/SpoVE family cell cycle protein [Bacteroidaceae bacterium]
MENTEDKPKRRQLLNGDRTIWTMVFILCGISLIEVFSASSRLTFGKSSFLAPIISHTMHLGIGLAGMWLVHLLHYKWYRLFPVLLVPLSILLLGYLSIRSMGSSGAERWINLGFFQLQPSELGKIGVIMSVAYWLSKLKPDDELSQANTFWKILALTGFVDALIVGENLSTAVLLAGVIFVMMILGGIAWRRMLALTGVVVGAGIVAVVILLFVPAQTIRDSKIIPSRATTWQARLQDFSQTRNKPNAYEYAKLVAPEKPQETHANIAIATSNILGKGPGNSDERDYLQEASCDFIYAIIIEELGIVGGVIVMLVYVVLLYRVGRIATKCKEKYPAYLAMGLGMLLGLQAFINMSVAVGLFPVTGQPLPLISKGGTSVLMTSGCIGMLLGISNVLEKEAKGEQALGTEADIPSPVDGNESFDEN